MDPARRGTDESVNEHMEASDLRPVRGLARCTIATLVLAGAAWAARAVWQIRLVGAGLPSSGPPDQGDGRHRPLTALENAYHLVSVLGEATTALCAIFFLTLLWRLATTRAPPRNRACVTPGHGCTPAGSSPPPTCGYPAGSSRTSTAQAPPGERTPRAVNVSWGLWLIGSLSETGLLYFGSTDTVIARAYMQTPCSWWPPLPPSARPCPASTSSAPSPQYSSGTCARSSAW